MRSGEETDNCETNVSGEYCSIDLKGKRLKERSLGEMEAEFLEALSSYYYEGKPRLSDEEFSLLKEELIWSGSKVRRGPPRRRPRQAGRQAGVWGRSGKKMRCTRVRARAPGRRPDAGVTPGTILRRAAAATRGAGRRRASGDDGDGGQRARPLAHVCRRHTCDRA